MLNEQIYGKKCLLSAFITIFYIEVYCFFTGYLDSNQIILHAIPHLKETLYCKEFTYVLINHVAGLICPYESIKIRHQDQ